MGQKAGPRKQSAERVVKEIRRVTRRQFSAEEKIRIVLAGLRGEESIAELCRRRLAPRPPKFSRNVRVIGRIVRLPAPTGNPSRASASAAETQSSLSGIAVRPEKPLLRV